MNKRTRTMKRTRTCAVDSDSNQQKFKKFDYEQFLNKNQITFTLDEKRTFLKACQENGLNVIYDIEKLKQYFPERTQTEIKYLVDVTQRKTKSRREIDECKDTPLEIWYSLCDQLIRSQIKKEDSSFCLIDLMERCVDSKYGNVYDNIKQLMEGKYPSKLSADDSIVFLSLINELTQFIQSQDLTSIKKNILKLYGQLVESSSLKESSKLSAKEDCDESLKYFEQIDPIKLRQDIQQASTQLGKVIDDQHNLKSVSSTTFYSTLDSSKRCTSNLISHNSSSDDRKSNIEINQHINQPGEKRNIRSETEKTKLNNTPTSTSEYQSNDQTISVEENPLYHYSQLPRIKKIKECLNPLGIETDLQRYLHFSIKSTDSN